MSAQYVKEFNADMGELSLTLVGSSHWKRYAAGSIASIQNKIENRKVLFIKKNVEKIEINISGEKTPYIIQKGKIDDDYLWIKNVLKRFSEKYKVNYIE